MKKFAAALSLAIALLFLSTSSAFAQDAKSILAQFDNEPTVAQVQEAALNYAGVNPERAESLYKRAGGANALPKNLSVGYRYYDRSESRTMERQNTGSSTATSNNYTEVYDKPTKYDQIDVKAQWDLSRLVYNPDQLRVLHEQVVDVRARNTLLNSVAKIYFARRKAQATLVTDPPTDVAQKLNLELTIQEHTANLDAMTGGWFSEQLKRAGK